MLSLAPNTPTGLERGIRLESSLEPHKTRPCAEPGASLVFGFFFVATENLCDFGDCKLTGVLDFEVGIFAAL